MTMRSQMQMESSNSQSRLAVAVNREGPPFRPPSFGDDTDQMDPVDIEL
jgi:hypothetical protein